MKLSNLPKVTWQINVCLLNLLDSRACSLFALLSSVLSQTQDFFVVKRLGGRKQAGVPCTELKRYCPRCSRQAPGEDHHQGKSKVTMHRLVLWISVS